MADIFLVTQKRDRQPEHMAGCYTSASSARTAVATLVARNDGNGSFVTGWRTYRLQLDAAPKPSPQADDSDG